MAFSGGTFSRTFDCTTDRDNGVKILASKFDTELDGMATGLSTCILKDGTQTCTAAIPFAEGLTVPDNKTIVLGTNSDITIQYDESTNDSLEIAANVEGAALGIVLKADQGDDNADQHKVNIADGGTLTMASKISGSFVSYLTHTPNSTVASSTTAVAGNLTVGGDLTLGSGAVISEAELEAIDGVTAGTVAASKAVIVDSNKDIASFRNVTLTGELDAGSLDVSGDADIDGTLEADAITVNGTALNTVIAGVTVTDATNSAHVLVTDNESTNEENLITFVEDATSSTGNVGLEMDGNLTYNPSTGTITATVFKGNIDAVDGDFDGTLEADAMTLNGTAITATATLDTGISNNNVPKFTSGVADNDFLRVDGTAIEGRSASEVLSDIAAAPAAGSSNIVTTGALNSGSITSGFGAIDNGSSTITTTGVITGGTVEATADTSAGDNAAIGYTSAEGLILTGQGSTSDITVKNDADAVVFTVPTGTDDILFPDGAKVIFGAGSDFSINHDASDGNLLTLAANPLEIHQAGTNSALQLYRDAGDGTLLTFFGGSTSRGSIITDTNLLTMSAVKDFKVRVNNGEIAADFLADGAVNLYHDTNQKLATTSGGISVTGEVAATSLDISGDIDVDGTTNLDAVDIDGAVDMASTLQVDGAITSSDGCTITTADNTAQLTLTSTDTDANSGPRLDFVRNPGQAGADNDFLSAILHRGYNDAGTPELITYAESNVQILDATDGSEDARFYINTMVAGSGRSRLNILPSETVFNEDSVDVDFRVESDNTTHALFVEGSSGNVGIGDSDPGRMLHIKALGTGTAEQAALLMENEVGTTGEIKQGPASDNAMIFTENGSERMRVNTSGALLIGKQADSIANNGISAAGSATGGGHLTVTNTSNPPMSLNLKTNDGSVLTFAKNGTVEGSVSIFSTQLAFVSGNTGLYFDDGSNNIIPLTSSGGVKDDTTDLGASNSRFDDIFATNGTIQTSDENEKQNIATLTSAEITAAKAISALFKTFKWKSKVTAKGDAARTHTGVVAQEVQAAMSAAGLDATKYAFWCSDTWWEKSTDVAAVEAVEEKLDEDGNLVTKAVEAKDAYTHVDTYSTEDEAPEGATKRTRLGVRYPELLAFIGAATEQRLADIETRLAALEAG